VKPARSAPVLVDMVDPVGSEGELAVARQLEERGFTVLARNLRLGHAEVDLLARRRSTLLVVEVKTRAPAAAGGRRRPGSAPSGNDSHDRGGGGAAAAGEGALHPVVSRPALSAPEGAGSRFSRPITFPSRAAEKGA
jgi:Uncharacterised protein family UPF0102